MSEDKVTYIRELAVRQLEALQNLGGDDIRGTALEIDLQLALASLKNNVNAQEVKLYDTPVSNVPADSKVQYKETRYEIPEDEDWDEDYIDEYGYLDGDEDEEYVLPVPAGFADEESYQAFLDTQNEATGVEYIDEETGEVYEVPTSRPDDVVGVVNGVEVGNMDESLAKVTEYVTERNVIRDEETDEVLYHNDVEEVPFIKVALTRRDNSELTVVQVLNNVLSSRESVTMLKTFGENFNIVDGENANQKVLRFFIDNDNETSRRAAQGLMLGGGMMQFGGNIVVPGVGTVSAEIVYE